MSTIFTHLVYVYASPSLLSEIILTIKSPITDENWSLISHITHVTGHVTRVTHHRVSPYDCRETDWRADGCRAGEADVQPGSYRRCYYTRWWWWWPVSGHTIMIDKWKHLPIIILWWCCRLATSRIIFGL